MANRFRNPFSRFCAFAALLSLSCLLRADEETAARRIGIIFEGNFESPEIARKPVGGETTLLVPFYQWDYGIRPFSKEEWNREELDWDRLIEITESLGDQMMETVEPQLVRDHREIVEYAILTAKEPFLSTVMFSDKLREKFKDTLGDRLLVVIIDRYRLYLFPGVGGTIEEYGPALVEEFQQTSLPVSLEVFLIDESGFRVIGELTRDAFTE